MKEKHMPKEHIQPEEVFASQKFGYTQVVTSPPGKLIFLSGQVALDKNFQLVGKDDIGAQAGQALSNLGASLEAAGARPSDVTSLRIYVAQYQPADAAAVGPLLEKFFAGSPLPAQTLLGVQTLAMPDLRIEIEAMAVVSD